ncbi:MAG: hypothetical protein ACLQPH_09465 [Acidimicrobiales bacterium]
MVASAWESAESAFESAARTAAPQDPGLAATTVPPLLGISRSLLSQMHSAGEVATGPIHLGPPHVTVAGERLAVVTACAHDAEIVVTSVTGRPVPGSLGEVENERFTSTMELTGSGWKLAAQTVEPNPCGA